jgi:L-methionine (R)-S-oxide reductase
MAEQITITSGADRKEIYDELLPQLKSLLSGEQNLIANAANICAALKEAFGFFWVGFYFVQDNELVLGPFQGPVACTRITKGKGVCGQAWMQEKTVLVPDVNAFPGHIACSEKSKSEIVVPLINNTGNVFGVLDVDSEFFNYFSETDQHFLESICQILVASVENH